MPKHIKTAEKLAELRDEESGVKHMTIRPSEKLWKAILAQAELQGNNATRETVNIISEYFMAKEYGVFAIFDPETRRRLDLIAGTFGIERDSIVKMIVGENIAKYLQRAIDIRAETDEYAATLDKKRGGDSAAEPKGRR